MSLVTLRHHCLGKTSRNAHLLPQEVILLGTQLVVPAHGTAGAVEVNQPVRPILALLINLGLQLVHIGVPAGQGAASQQLLLVCQLHSIQRPLQCCTQEICRSLPRL